METEHWSEILNTIKIDSSQKTKIIAGKFNALEGKLKLEKIFGKIPDSIWDVRYGEKLDLSERTQQKIVELHRNDTLKIYDKSTRNTNIRWKGAISIFPNQILNQLIDFYTNEGDTIFDCFAGHNSRMEPSYLKRRNYIGWDCSKEFMSFNREVREKLLKYGHNKTTIKLVEGDSRYADEPDNSADFIFTSPPFWNLEYYGDEKEQLGNLSYEDFIKDITLIYKQCFRILKPGKFCIINVNDFRKGGKYYAYHSDTIHALNDAGFIQYDTIIMKYSSAMRKCFPNQILEEKLMPKIFEYLLVFYKPPGYEHSAVYPFNKKTS